MAPPSRPRLLPWSSPEGKPCYLASDGDGPVTRQADTVERVQLASGEVLLGHARALLRDNGTTTPGLRFPACCLTGALGDTLRISRSRGDRLGCRHPEPAEGEAALSLDAFRLGGG